MEDSKQIGHILRRNCLLQDSTEGQMMKVVGRTRTQLLDNLRNRRRYFELKEEVEGENDSLSHEHEEEI